MFPKMGGISPPPGILTIKPGSFRVNPKERKGFWEVFFRSLSYQIFFHMKAEMFSKLLTPFRFKA